MRRSAWTIALLAAAQVLGAAGLPKPTAEMKIPAIKPRLAHQ